MTDREWSELFRKVPEEAQNALLIGLHNGTNIAVQDFLRVDDRFLLLRGRIAGTSDTGQMFCLPYDKLLYCCVTRPLPENVIVQIFGELLHPLVDRGPLVEAEEPQPPTPAPEPAPVTPPALTPPPLSPSSAGTPGLASLRERLRAKLSGSSGESRKP
ncbi:MAG: hypothetical protein NZM31_10420 [Gemmatales bacterium]|nr:hypothetical protein [Gemmatales bacterium]MDW8387411.1 hypothetical protein [Gemmatales bacterium]